MTVLQMDSYDVFVFATLSEKRSQQHPFKQFKEKIFNRSKYYFSYIFMFLFFSGWLSKVCYLKYVGKVSQIEDIVEAYGCRKKVLANFLVQADSCLFEENQKIVTQKQINVVSSQVLIEMNAALAV